MQANRKLEQIWASISIANRVRLNCQVTQTDSKMPEDCISIPEETAESHQLAPFAERPAKIPQAKDEYHAGYQKATNTRPCANVLKRKAGSAAWSTARSWGRYAKASKSVEKGTYQEEPFEPIQGIQAVCGAEAVAGSDRLRIDSDDPIAKGAAKLLLHCPMEFVNSQQNALEEIERGQEFLS